MIISTSKLNTDHGIDHLRQLSAHFAKRVKVEMNDHAAHIKLPIGTCDLTACQTAISAHVCASADHIDRMEEVFGSWIERYAFRENANLTWHRAIISKGD